MEPVPASHVSTAISSQDGPESEPATVWLADSGQLPGNDHAEATPRPRRGH
jgi:hypothetical protein